LPLLKFQPSYVQGMSVGSHHIQGHTHTHTHTHLVEVLWTRDRPVAEIL